jgi:hypothetical protein
MLTPRRAGERNPPIAAEGILIMPIAGQGWELHIVRQSEQERASDRRRRTVGTYQVFHDGIAQIGADLWGLMAESKGPGANRPAGNGKRVEPGTYPLFTQAGAKYVTWNYAETESLGVLPRPGIELKDTGERTEILIHPGVGFLASIGCLNPCASLPHAGEPITYRSSRRRVIALIEDMKAFLGRDFPRTNGRAIPRAAVVIEGEPSL